MPHLRTRHLTQLLRSSLSFSSIVGILGHRQVGKTTIATVLSDNYFTLDLARTLGRVNDDPLGFLETKRKNLLVIDECQLSPNLFPALKEFVRINKRPGQFLLTGSVRFSSRKVIRESLTGRIINWELLPMDYSELHGMPLPKTIPRLIEAKNVELELGSFSSIQSEVERYLRSGGLPGIFAVRGEAHRLQKFESQLQTLLDRDLRLVLETSLPFRTLFSVVGYLADRQGLPLNLTDASRQTRVSIPTLRKLLSAFEAIYLIRIYKSEGGQIAPIVYLEDQGEASYLSTKRTELQEIEHYLYANLRTQWMYRPELKVTLTQYRTRGGALVPLVLRSPKGVLGILPSLEENPGESALRSAGSFLKANPEAKVLYVHLGKKDEVISRRERIVTAGMLVGSGK